MHDIFFILATTRKHKRRNFISNDGNISVSYLKTMPVSDNQNDCALKLSVNSMHFESEVNGLYATKCSNDKRIRDYES